MLQVTEKSLEANLCKSVKRWGGFAVKFWPISFTGLPDRLVLMPGGRAYFAEIKAPGKKPKPHQETAHKLLRNLGFTVAVIDDHETLKTFLEEITC